MKKAFITGITGQDGSYLAEFLLDKGYEVHGIKRRSSSINTDRIDHIYQDPHDKGRRLFLHYGDLSDTGNIRKLIFDIQPDEVYHLGAQSHVRVSFDTPEYTADITGLGTIRLLEAIKDLQNKVERKLDSIKRHQVRCLVQPFLHKTKRRHFIQGVHMVAQKYLHTIQLLIIERHMEYLL